MTAVDRDPCARKVRYGSYAAAARSIVLSKGLADKPATAYKCPRCRGFHVTSHPRKPRRAK